MSYSARGEAAWLFWEKPLFLILAAAHCVVSSHTHVEAATLVWPRPLPLVTRISACALASQKLATHYSRVLNGSDDYR